MYVVVEALVGDAFTDFAVLLVLRLDHPKNLGVGESGQD